MLVDGCVACAMLTRKFAPPGGIIHDAGDWVIFLRSQPLLAPGQGFIVLKRRCEHLRELSAAELATPGPLLQRTKAVYHRILHTERVHFGLYAEDVRRIHWHIAPRLTTLPAGNIPLTLLGLWRGALARLRLWRLFDDYTVAMVAAELRTAYHHPPTP